MIKSAKSLLAVMRCLIKYRDSIFTFITIANLFFINIKLPSSIRVFLRKLLMRKAFEIVSVLSTDILESVVVSKADPLSSVTGSKKIV